MAMPIRSLSLPTYTVHEIESWPDDGNRYEVLDGMLLVTPSPSMPHQLVASELAHVLAELLGPWPAIRVSAPGVIVLRPKTQLEPDILVFRPGPGRLSWERAAAHLLAVEVMSRSTRVYDRLYKRPAYLALGVEEAWRVDPVERMLFVSRAGGPPDRPCKDVVEWRPSFLGVTLTIPLDRIFRGLPE